MINRLKEVDIHVNSFAITPVETYPADKDALMAVARTEKENDSRPELTSKCSGYKDVNHVVLIVPNWFNAVPMGVMTFLDENSGAGKRIIPVVLHAGDGAEAIVKELRSALPKADVMEPIAVENKEVECIAAGGNPISCGCADKFAKLIYYLK